MGDTRVDGSRRCAGLWVHHEAEELSGGVPPLQPTPLGLRRPPRRSGAEPLGTPGEEADPRGPAIIVAIDAHVRKQRPPVWMPGGWVSDGEFGSAGFLVSVKRLADRLALRMRYEGREHLGRLQWDPPPMLTTVEEVLQANLGKPIRDLGELDVSRGESLLLSTASARLAFSWASERGRAPSGCPLGRFSGPRTRLRCPHDEPSGCDCVDSSHVLYRDVLPAAGLAPE